MLSVDICVVGREITFLAQFSVYTRPYQSPGQRSALPGNLVTIDLGKGKSVASTLGGFVTITPKREKDAFWFRLTTWHGIQEKNDSDLDMEKQQEPFLIQATRTLLLASKVEDNKEETKFEGKQKASEPAQQIGHGTLGSGSLLNREDDVSEYIDTEIADEGNLDSALPDLFKDRPECYPFSKYRNDIFEPSDPSIDIDETTKVILLNRAKGYPEAQISHQWAFLSFPPSMELVELLTFRPNGSEVLTPGDSGTWVINVDVSGKMIVHGQVVAVKSLGDGLLMPMSSIVADIRNKLSPIFKPRLVQVKIHVPLDAVNLEDMADFIRDWALPRMNQEE
ncbi:hypothetical protein QBC38DRAFT_448008 [Podospora fimiseda]|uniref:Uncharacterized protein n=1 Tax=Podospora fimiseda TaxID=252190 RepID=A0AAN7BEE1_9PEZI|nr:hypothetical protein QBC38DRAFT_448008 [Podospora fimiseda]